MAFCRPRRRLLSVCDLQQFDIGVESDTLDAATDRTTATVPFVSIGWDGVLGEWLVELPEAWGTACTSQDRPTLNAPSLDRVAYVPGQRATFLSPWFKPELATEKHALHG